MKEMVIFYSSFEEDKRLKRMKELMENGFQPRHAGMLVTFINITNQNKLMKKLQWFHERGIRIMVDSGAHSIQYAKDREAGLWMGHEVSKAAKDIVESGDYDGYMKRYISFAKKWRDVVDIFVELDIQRVVGMEKVLSWREWWKKIDVTPMYVWHGEEDALSWLSETKYIGIGGTNKVAEMEKDELERQRLSISKKFKKKDEGCWIHIFALTAFDVLRRAVGVYDSVDSSSWKMGSRYGMVYREAGGRLQPVSWKESPNEIRACIRKYRDELEEYGFHVDDMLEFKDFIELDFWNIFIMDKYLDKILTMASSGRVERFSCAVCPVADKCKYYREDADGCEWIESMIETMDLDNLLEDTIRFVIESRLRRYLRGLAIEEMDSGLLDKHVTQLEDGIVKMIETYIKLRDPERFSGKRMSGGIDIDEIIKRIDSMDE